MTDIAWQLLQSALQQNGDRTALWLLDENIGEQEIASVCAVDNLQAVTNRYDVYLALQRNGFKAKLSDYDFSEYESDSFDAVYYRVSKEKAVVHHIINAAYRYLSNDGKLYLAGFKNEGIKTYCEKAATLLGSDADKQRGAKNSLLAVMSKASADANDLDDKNYTQLTAVTAAETLLITKPGIFGWNKVDQGSAFLIDYLGNNKDMLSIQPQRIIDLGCGYGYLSVMANKIFPVEYLATDNNIAAVNACKKNFSKHAIQGEVLLDNCAESIAAKADLIICNPPFHQGFGVDSDLTSRFLQAAKNLLNKDGLALFVVNGFIPLEKKAAPLFAKVEVVASNRSFKVVAVSFGGF